LSYGRGRHSLSGAHVEPSVSRDRLFEPNGADLRDAGYRQDLQSTGRSRRHCRGFLCFTLCLAIRSSTRSSKFPSSVPESAMIGSVPQHSLVIYLVGISPMDHSHDESGDVESTSLGTEALMETQIIQKVSQETGIPPPKALCVHLRLIDDVRTRSGRPTGKVRCLECGTIFDDPHRDLH